jgi:hypothetical protein
MCVMVARGPVWDDGLGIRLFVVGGGASVWPTMKCAHTMEGVWSLLIKAVGFGSKGSMFMFLLLSRLTMMWHHERCMAGALPEK